MEYVAKVERAGKHTLIEFPDCPGCQTFAGPGEHVESIARDALEGWLVVHLEGGEAPPKPSYKDGTGRLPVRIALQIRWRRQELGLSQAQLAERIGVTRQAASNLENPDSNLRLTTLAKAAEALEAGLGVELMPLAPRRRLKRLG
jgi:DNA-binding XRE family transcriptional regulator/predicted RNase H-like HicB family nuclease